MAIQEHTLLVESRHELSSSEDIRPAAPAEILYSEPVVVPPEAPLQLDRISSGSIIQDGVQAIEGITRAWDGRLFLIVSYISIMLMAIVTSLEGQVTSPLLPIVTSSFQQHSLVSTIYVVRGVVFAVIKPPMAKLADVFGRLEAFSLSVGLFVLGYIQMAASNNAQTFVSAQIFYSAGSSGLLLLQQIFIADTSDLSYRALCSTLPDLPFLGTTWIGAIIGQHLLDTSGSWRWAFAMWTIILPAAFLPLAISLFKSARAARNVGLAPASYTSLKGNFVNVLQSLWGDLDIGGILLLTSGFTLILVPCTIAETANNGWGNGGMIAMVTIGAIFLIAFPFWEVSSSFARRRRARGKPVGILASLAPYPLIPLHLLKKRTFAAGSFLAVFYFMAFYLSVQPYFSSYLLVVKDLDLQSSAYILNAFNLSSTVSSLIVSGLIKLTNRYKWFVFAGSCFFTLGVGLMLRYHAEDASLAAIIGTQVLIGFGGGMLNVPAQLGVQATAGHQHVGVATAVFLTLISVGGAIGSAISGAVWGRLFPKKLQQYLPSGSQDQATAIFRDINQALHYKVGSPERIAINRSIEETMQRLVTYALCVCSLLLLSSLLMSDYDLSEIEQGVTGRVIGGEVGLNEKKEGDRESYMSKMVRWLKNR